jgi:foldase protein PrsA
MTFGGVIQQRSAIGKKPRRRLPESRRVGTFVFASMVALALPLVLGACGAEDQAGTEDTLPEPSGYEQPSTAAPSTPTMAEPAATDMVATVMAPTVPEPTATPTVVTPPAPLAALVNGEYVFLSDYQQEVALYEQALVEQGLDLDSEDAQADLGQMRQEVLEGLIDYVLIKQAAEALGVTLGDEELEGLIEADITAGGGEAAFEEWLQATGQSREEYRELVRQALLSQLVLEAVTSDLPEAAEQVKVRVIVLDSEEAARQVLDLLQQGADFAETARERSLDLTTKDEGGDLGWLPRGVVEPELEDAAFDLQAGGISDVIVLGGEYYIIQVEQREDARPLTADAYLDLQLTAFEQWLDGQREAAEIERFVGE